MGIFRWQRLLQKCQLLLYAISFEKNSEIPLSRTLLWFPSISNAGGAFWTEFSSMFLRVKFTSSTNFASLPSRWVQLTWNLTMSTEAFGMPRDLPEALIRGPIFWKQYRELLHLFQSQITLLKPFGMPVSPGLGLVLVILDLISIMRIKSYFHLVDWAQISRAILHD